jgi:hypothetical protein
VFESNLNIKSQLIRYWDSSSEQIASVSKGDQGRPTQKKKLRDEEAGISQYQRRA